MTVVSNATPNLFMMRREEIVTRETLEYKDILLKRIQEALFEELEYKSDWNSLLEEEISLGDIELIDNIYKEFIEDEQLYDNFIESKVNELINVVEDKDMDEDYLEEYSRKEYPLEKFEKYNFNQQEVLNIFLNKVHQEIYYLFFPNIRLVNLKTNKLNFFIVFIFYKIIDKNIYIKFLIEIINNTLKYNKRIISVQELIDIAFTEQDMETSSIYLFIKKYDSSFNYRDELYQQLDNLTTEEEKYIFSKEVTKRNAKAIIWTEGKTDWKHLKKALLRFLKQSKYLNLNIEFEEYEDIDMGDAEIDRMIQTYSKTKQSKRHIFVLDRDNSKYVNKYGKNKFNNHKNNVYSFCIPKISDELDKICIEFYYQKSDIQTEDKFGRRIFLGEEFKGKGDGNSQCGKYVTEKRNAVALDIIDRDKKVFMAEDIEKKDNIALSKNDFTNHIINDVDGFDNFDIENFKLIFDVIEKIIND